MGLIYVIFDLAGVSNSTSKDRGESMLEKVSTRFCRQTQDYIYKLCQAFNKLPLNNYQVIL